MVDPTKTVTNPRIAKLIQYEDKLDATDRHELETYRNQGLAPKRTGATTTEAEKTAGFLATRVAGGMEDVNRAVKDDPSAERPSVLPSIAGGIFGQAGRNYANDDERQRVENAQLDILDSALTLGTGAAYSREQLDGYRQSYFPQLGEGEGAIADKKIRLKRLLQAAKLKAGGSAPLIDQALADVDGDAPPADPANKERLSLLDAPGVAIDTALGARDGGPTEVSVSQSPQTPEFRAGLNALLDNPATTKEQILEYWDKNNPGALEKGANPKPAPLATERGEDGVIENADAAVRGAADTMTLGLATRGAAIADTVANGGTYAENLARQRGVDLYDEQVNPRMRIAGQLAGGLAVPTGIAGAGVRAEEAALTAGRTAQEAKVASRYGIAKRMGVEGAGLGAAYGLNTNYGDIGEKVGSAATGAMLGGGLGYGLGRLGILAGARGDRPLPPSPGLNDGPLPTGPANMGGVADRLGITPAPATTGGGAAAGIQRGLGNLPGSAGPVRNAVDAEAEALAAKARETAAKMGTVSTPSRAGEIIARGAKVADRTAARKAGDVYNGRTAMMGGEGAPVTMGGTEKAVSGVVNDFASNEVVSDLLTHPLIRKMESAEAKELTLGEATELLSESRRVLNKARQTKQPGRLIGQLRSLEQAIEGDVMRAAQASDAIAGRDAASGAAAAQVKGDGMWAERMGAQGRELKRALASATDDVNTSSESVYRQMIGDMAENSGNLTRLRRTLAKLPKRAQDTFAASAFDDLGRAKNSAQNTESDAWSFNTFKTNWAGLSDDAKRVAFGGRGVDREVSDIVRYADRLSVLDKSRNFSGTTPNQMSSASLAAAVGALVTGNVKTAIGVAGTYAGLNGLGRAFVAVPALRQWTRSLLGASIKGNDAQLRTLTKRLPALAAAHPGAKAEIDAVRNFISGFANDNASVGSAAASGEQGQNQQEAR